MVIIDFNDCFSGFKEKEDILIDTGVLYALLNKYDEWYSTIQQLFKNHIFNNENPISLFINPNIQFELTHLLGRAKKHFKITHPDLGITERQIDEMEIDIIATLEMLIRHDIFLIMRHDKESMLHQLKLYKKYGSKDAANLALANKYRISFLTLDNELVTKTQKNREDIPNIDRIYFTTLDHMTY